MINDSTIILCGGQLNYNYLPINTSQSNAMITVNGKPVIGWILDDLIAKKIDTATVVLQKENHTLLNYLKNAFSRRLEINIVEVEDEGTIVTSLYSGLENSPARGLVRVILGDTLISDPFDSSEDFVYTGAVEDSRRWCLVETGKSGNVVGFIEKKENVKGGHEALAGYYHFINGDCLRNCCEQVIVEGEKELSDVLKLYNDIHPIRARHTEAWYDFGHIDNLVDARKKLLQSRYFNSLIVDSWLNTVTKVSDFDSKLQDELHWYLNIPDELKVLTPRIVKTRQINGRMEMTQEYYGYPTLSELYVYGNMHPDIWLSILKLVMKIHDEFRKYSGDMKPNAVINMYLDKTWERINEVVKSDSKWRRIFDYDKIVFNDAELLNIGLLEKFIRGEVGKLAESAFFCVVHGDFCFSNILFDINNKIIRLIDPRGNFGGKGIYGDARYDVAKLRHSICGKYDFIMEDLFYLQEEGNVFNGEIFVDNSLNRISERYDSMLEESGYDLSDIKFIEGLLFFSMLPIHQGHALRQRMMYLRGLSLLNEVINENRDRY
ncbi:sugar phosphate nucleotidyltransferase [Nitrospinota bacterium]